MTMNDTQPLAEVKARFSHYVDGVEHSHDRLVITRNGRAAAVLISPDDLESMEETLEILADPEALEAIREAQAEVARGEVASGRDLAAAWADRSPAAAAYLSRIKTGP